MTEDTKPSNEPSVAVAASTFSGSFPGSGSNKPKNLGRGVTSGVSNVLAGAIGGVGVAVLSPTLGATMGWKEGGVAGGLIGLTGGAAVGIVGGAAMIVGGAVSGVSQIVKGVLAVPQQIIAPRQGKWWNDATSKWVYTDLSKADVPDDDDDLLKGIKDLLDSNAENGTEGETGTVEDTYYYDMLEVDPSAEPSAIKRRYYVLARKYHPDKVGSDDEEATTKFKEISEAYQILSDPELRTKYDRGGRAAIAEQEKDEAQTNVEPAVIFAFLFGSDQFRDYTGRLATSTSAMLGDSPRLSVENARKLQERRCTRLAKSLVDRLQPWMAVGNSDDKSNAETVWGAEAERLCGTSYGPELVNVIGMAYQLSSAQFLGSLDSGVGMPSISKWAKAHQASLEQMRQKNKIQQDSFKTALDMARLQADAKKRMENASTPEEKAAIQAELQKASQESLLHLLFTTTVVDITATLHETCQMVFHDQNVDKTVRKARAKGVDALGKAFRQAAASALLTQEKKESHVLYEEAAFAAMLETVKRKDESAQGAAK